jgi:SAM-dependent methyltransferase
MDQAIARNILEKTKADYESIAAEFSATRSFLWEELKGFGEYVEERDSVLDLGCGNGRLFRLFKGRNIYYLGVDASSSLIELARKIWQGAPASFEVRDALEMNYSGEFDVAFAIALLHHIPSREFRERAVRNIAAALKPGGILILTTWNLWQLRFWPGHVREFIARKFRRSELDFGDLLIPWKKGMIKPVERYYHGFRKSELISLLQNAGLEIMDRYYSRRGERTSWLRGYNLIIIARKPELV